MSSPEMYRLLQFFRVVSDETRLRMIGFLAIQERSVEELATLVMVTAPTASHHLSLLRKLGIVAMRPEGNTHLYRLDGTALRTMSKELLTPESTAEFVEDMEGGAWERKVLRDFFDGQRLKEIPASQKKRLVILHWLAQQFALDTEYTEAQVNDLLRRHHADVATLRRELIEHRLLCRDNNIYQRLHEAPVA